MEVSTGDYVLIPFAPCYRASVDADLRTGTHVITVKDHRPAAKPRVVHPEPGRSARWVDVHQDGVDWRTECGLCGWTLRGLATRTDAERAADEHEASCGEST